MKSKCSGNGITPSKDGKTATAICALPEMVEKIKRLESEREYLKDVLRGIRAHIETLDSAALGVDSEVGFSYRDEMVSRIDVAVASYESKE